MLFSFFFNNWISQKEADGQVAFVRESCILLPTFYLDSQIDSAFPKSYWARYLDSLGLQQIWQVISSDLEVIKLGRPENDADKSEIYKQKKCSYPITNAK